MIRYFRRKSKKGAHKNQSNDIQDIQKTFLFALNSDLDDFFAIIESLFSTKKKVRWQKQTWKTMTHQRH